MSACLQLMEISFPDKFLSSHETKPIAEPQTPESPVGVIDAAACGSCESQRSSTPAAPGAKRRRLDQFLCREEYKHKDDNNKDSEGDGENLFFLSK